MKVVLLQNIKGVGRIGDIKNVSDGYAKNFLLPRKVAKLANDGSLKEAEELKNKSSISVETGRKNAFEAVEKLKVLVIELTRKASKTGKLFAGIGKEDLVKEIKKVSKVELEEEMLDHDEPIKQIGEHLIDIQLAPDIKAQVRIVVKAE